MKATNYIIIGGGALALLLLLKNKQNTKLSTIAKGTTTGGTTTGGTTTSGTTTGGNATAGNATAGTSQVTSFPTPTSNEPEQVFGLGLPTGMDLPILTAGTGIPTEVAVQQGGVSTTPTPAITPPPPLGIEESLELGGIKPIINVKPFLEPTIISEPSDTTPYITPLVVPTPRPYEPTVNLQEYPSYNTQPYITPLVTTKPERDIIQPTVNLQQYPSYNLESYERYPNAITPLEYQSNTDNWIIPRLTKSYEDARPYNPEDYQFLI